MIDATTTRQRPTRMKARECIGEIHPDAMYTMRRLLEVSGIGRVSLTEGVKSGVIKKHGDGRRVWVEGKDVIAWIKQQRQ